MQATMAALSMRASHFGQAFPSRGHVAGAQAACKILILMKTISELYSDVPQSRLIVAFPEMVGQPTPNSFLPVQISAIVLCTT
jgi:hypothetical protein